MAKNIITLEPMVSTATAVAVKNHDLIADADKNIFIMKGRKINKNTTK